MNEPAQRRPLPPHIRTLSPSRIDPTRREPALPPDPPPAPDWLDADAQAEWRRLAPALAAHWRPEFSDSLEVYVVALVRFRKHPEQATPALLAQLRLLQSTLGMSPRAAAALARERGR